MKFTKKQLPLTIVCPVCGSNMKKGDLNPNNMTISAAQFMEDCTEYYDGELAPYDCPNDFDHTVYLTYE